MSRFLFVVPPLVGHVNPAAGVAAELAGRGHEVAWAGVPAVVRALVGEDAAVFPCDGPQLGVRPSGVRGVEALKLLWERFLVPLAERMAPGVHAAVEGFRPDVVVADQQAFAGGLVAERLGLRWATSATTSGELGPALDRLPLVAGWIGGRLAALRERIGDPSGTADPRFSPHLVLAFTTPELAGPPGAAGPVPRRIAYVGPSIAARPCAPGFPWEWLDPGRRTVLVTLGTANPYAGTRFLAACREAALARADRVQTVIADPGGVLPPDGRGRGDVLVAGSVPQLPLLARAAAVVCHAGHNTVCEALWHGVPLVVAPIRDDQTVVAAQVAEAGAGVRVRFGRATADGLGRALDDVLDRPAHRTAAARVRRSFRAAGGAPAAAAHLERLAAAPAPTPLAADHLVEER